MKYICLLIMHGYTVEFKPVFDSPNGGEHFPTVYIKIHIHKDGSGVMDIFPDYMQVKKFVKKFWLYRHTN